MWRLAVPLLVVAGVSLTASPAKASCGDYVTVGTAHADASHEPAKPCDGPNCSHQQERPLPPVAPSVPPGEHPFCSPTTQTRDAADPAPTLADPAGRRPAGFPSRLERPPRV